MLETERQSAREREQGRKFILPHTTITFHVADAAIAASLKRNYIFDHCYLRMKTMKLR